ncbi:MAG TPA: AbrB/MazE/SpoVT family DNA-binding domain-containing protein [Chloroflexi bacterium]|nr:AbrB/MazE/SpoVT family DNA-binding domain-containing protein [Chloroflexota bacterium]
METKVKKWGNSLALRIPKPLAIEAGLENDSPVELSLLDGKLVIEPIDEEELSLEMLLAQVTESNLHDEVDTGPALGGEVW